MFSSSLTIVFLLFFSKEDLPLLIKQRMIILITLYKIIPPRIINKAEVNKALSSINREMEKSAEEYYKDNVREL